MRFIIQRKISKEDWDNYILVLVGKPYKNKEQFIPADHSLITEWDYNESSGNPITCNYFGCGKTLTLRECLFGNYCIKHSAPEHLAHIVDKALKYF